MTTQEKRDLAAAEAFIYISRPGCWFDVGTAAVPLIPPFGDGDIRSCLFLGIRNGELDEEMCWLDEFDILERVV